MRNHPFVIRVYGLYIHPGKGVLVSDEFVYGQYITKFPGGGLEFGEGTIDCLRREMMEETGNPFEVLEHFYTTDNFVQSAFHPGLQVLSIYYLIQPVAELDLQISENKFDFEPEVEGAQSFRWIAMESLKPDDLHLPIDRHVAQLLKNRFSSLADEKPLQK